MSSTGDKLPLRTPAGELISFSAGESGAGESGDGKSGAGESGDGLTGDGLTGGDILCSSLPGDATSPAGL